ncbi:LOW QUALITY PROTEIN: hypothetical protein SETIT_6G211700v2 [Setaria italica]|uniref:Uncharacterized protein n=2 Tax=Setaria italica TaxID=4555 RepID=A0A368RNW9_SETIT|nr:LOW QUALITY PROTEIN: hypothetical protein SETIT_6G211700v2 [Setaria italica]
MDGRDPAPVSRDAVAGALVHYYPLAGRLRELEGRAPGVLFVEADADVRLEHIGDAVHPPLPCLDELLFDVPGSSAIVNSPLLLFQVTRLAYGGFVVAVRLNHVMADAQGLLQFLEAVAELARGVAVPAVQPVWERHLLMARDPPRPSFPHPEYNEVPVPPDTNPGAAVPVDANAMARCSFFFGAREITAIKALLPPHLRNRSTTFEILLGFLWKLLTMALAPDDDEEVHVGFVASARGGKSGGLHIPNGYYGNSFALPVAIHGRRAPREPGGPRRGAGPEGQGGSGRGSVADHMALRGRPNLAAARVYHVRPDQVGFGDLDYGWGRPVYGGAASVGPIPGCSSFLVRGRNADGEDGVVVPMWLPGPAMDRFKEEMGKLLRPPAGVPVPRQGLKRLICCERKTLFGG